MQQKFKVRPMNPLDLAIIRPWHAEARTMGHIGGYALSYGNLGVILVGYLHPSYTGAAFMTSFLGNPKIIKEIRREACKYMILWLSDEARRRGCPRVISTPSIDSLTRAFVESGFSVFPQKVDYVWKDV